MIFVTVGTHEQPFNRLVEYIDDLKRKRIIEEKVIIQTGFSTYEPIHCEWMKFFPYQQMIEYVKEARIIITHGGPASFVMALQVGKVPIVVPRQKKFGEHINNHQMDFCKEVAARQKNIICVEDIKEISHIILDYEKIVEKLATEDKSNNLQFNQKFCKLVEELMNENK